MDHILRGNLSIMKQKIIVGIIGQTIFSIREASKRTSFMEKPNKLAEIINLSEFTREIERRVGS